MDYTTKVFPVDALPEKLSCFVQNTAEALSCPPDFPGIFALSVMSAAIGSTRVVRLKEGWTEPPVLYSVVVAPPASKKSPVFKLAMKPVIKKQLELKREYDINKAAFEVEMELWEKSKKSSVRPPKPLMGRNFVNDFTIEALAKILRNNPKGLLLGMDEISAWINSMDQYRKGRGADREKWLSLWTCSDIVVDRVSIDDSIVLHRPFVSVTGGTQPDKLKLFQADVHDGFMDRILFTFPEPVQDRWVEDGVSKTLLDAYGGLYDQLFALEQQPPLDGGPSRPVVLDLNKAAKENFIRYFELNLNDIETEGDPYLKSTFKKMEAYVGRFALILQLCERPESLMVEDKAVASAAVLAEYFKSHARKVRAHLRGKKVNENTLRAVQALKSYGGPMTLRDCYTKRIAGCKDAVTAQKLFRELANDGYGKIEEIRNSTGGRPTIQFRLNGL